MSLYKKKSFNLFLFFLKNIRSNPHKDVDGQKEWFVLGPIPRHLAFRTLN